MRLSKRNKQTVYYANYVSRSGQVITYSTPVLAEWNVQTVSASADIERFGIASKNTVKIVAEKPLPVNSKSILWIGITPASPYSATSPGHNYVMDGIPITLNEGVFYAKLVDVS